MRMLTIVVCGMVLCLVAGFSGLAFGTTITVDWAGSGDELNIQGGMIAAGPGDTVLVLAGTYTGPSNRDLDCGGTNMVVMSDGGAAVTIIDCQDAGRGFFFDNCEDTTSLVKGFTITNAAADSGAGAFCTRGSDPRFEDCTFEGNAASAAGGGLCSVDSSPIIRNCRFEGNSAGQSGKAAAYGGGMACFGFSAPEIEGSRFESNLAYSMGGGLFCDYAAVSCSYSDFVGNNLIGYGNAGGGAALSFADGASFEGCTFTENGTTQTIVGAGLYVNACAVTVSYCDFTGNVGGAASGARFVFSAGGTVSRCAFYGNVSTWGYATAGIECFSSSNPIITGCTFAKNWGHHIECSSASPTIEYCILAFSEAGDPVICDQGTETPHIHHCFVFGNADTDTLCGGNHNDIVNSDPLFCDMFSENFMLCENSPCIAGATWPSLVGSEWEGCAPCGSAVKPESWGAIKAIYR